MPAFESWTVQEGPMLCGKHSCYVGGLTPLSTEIEQRYSRVTNYSSSRSMTLALLLRVIWKMTPPFLPHLGRSTRNNHDPGETLQEVGILKNSS
jgi:hypothetical protein